MLYNSLIYDKIMYDGKPVRFYDLKKVDVFKYVYSELQIRFEVLQKYEYSFYVGYGVSKNYTALSQGDLDYFKLTEEEYDNLSPHYKYSDSIRKIKNNKLKDLLFLQNLPDLDVIFFVPRCNKNNFFYYDLILGFNKQHSLEGIKDFNSNLIELEELIPYGNLNMSFEFIQSFFKLEENFFRETVFPEYGIKLICDHMAVMNCLEKKALDEYYDKAKKKRWSLVDQGVSSEEALQKYLEWVNTPKIKHLEENYSKKQSQLTDGGLQNKLYYKCISNQLITFSKRGSHKYDENTNSGIFREEFYSFSNYYECLNSSTVSRNEDGSINLQIEPCGSILDDAFDANHYNLGMSHCIHSKEEIKVDENDLLL